MAVIKSIFKYFVILLTISKLSLCLFEDQIGKFDWKKTYLGQLKYASFDSVKRIVVATEENVVASVNLKNGQVAWRQLLENTEANRIELLYVDTEALTVSGNGVTYYIRGWDLNSGSLLYEWSMSPERQDGRWVIAKTSLLHVVPVVNSHVEITEYQIKTGLNKGSTSRISTPWMTDLTQCVIAETFWVCKTNDSLYNLDLTDSSKVHKQLLNSLIGDVPGEVSIHEITHLEPAILLKRNNVHRFVLIGESTRILPHSLQPNVISVSNGEQNMLVQMEYENGKPVQIKSIDLNGDETKVIALEESDLIAPKLVVGICRSSNCRLLYTCADNSVSLLQLPSGKTQWTREEALSTVVSTEFVELPLSESDASIEREFNEASNDIFSMFTRRLLSQARQFTMFVTGQQASTKDALVRDDFGLHKLIILATKVGKLFAIHTITGDIIWTHYIPEIAPFNTIEKENLLLYQQRTARYAPLPAEMMLIGKDPVTDNGIMYKFDPITGKPLSEIMRLNFKIKQAMLLPFEDKGHIKPLLLLSENNDIHVYPPSAKTILNQEASSLFLFKADTEKNTLNGYSLQYSDSKSTPTWNINFANSQIVAVTTRPVIERVHSQGRVLADRSVFYKYVNPNLIAIATISDDILHKHVLSVYLVDGITGLVVHSAHHKRANAPVHMVHSENWIVYSYFSERFRRFEVTAIELYEGARQSNSTAFSSHALSQLPHPEMLSYILPVNPLAMVATLTERGITNKHVLMALSNGAVLEMPWAYLQPRGPHLPSNPEEGYIPYMPELPIQSEAIINYNQSLAHVRGIQVSPARLESTSLVIIYGLDLFYTRVMPSKTFDVLKEDFDHWLIVMVLVGLTLASYVTKHLSIRKALKQVWK